MAHKATTTSIGFSRQSLAAQIAILRSGGLDVYPNKNGPLGGVYVPSQSFSRIFCHFPIATLARYFETNYALRLRRLLIALLRKVAV